MLLISQPHDLVAEEPNEDAFTSSVSVGKSQGARECKTDLRKRSPARSVQTVTSERILSATVPKILFLLGLLGSAT